MTKGQITHYFYKKSTLKETHAKCNKCKQWRPKNAFGRNKNFPPDFLARQCKNCHNTRNRVANISKARLRTSKLATIKKKYEIEEAQYFGRLRETSFACPMCRRKLRHIDDSNGEKSTIDHKPGTGVIYVDRRRTVYSGIPSVTRGVICDDCNNCIGRGNDDMARLVRGSQYLMTWGTRHKYLKQHEIDEYKKSLQEALESVERVQKEESDWTDTYHT